MLFRSLVMKIVQGGVVPNLTSFELRLHGPHFHRYLPYKIMIQCRPEEARPDFWDILVDLPKEKHMLDFII